MALLVVSAFGMVRVTLYAQAAETLAASQRMKQELRAARLTSDDLEILPRGARATVADRSIAASTMSMGKPISVKYIALPKTLPQPAASTTSTRTSASSIIPEGVEGLAAAAAQITAREAQVLLASGSGLGPR